MSIPLTSTQIGTITIILLTAVIFMGASASRLVFSKEKELRGYDITDLLTGVIMVIAMIIFIASFANYTSGDSPDRLPKTARYAVVNYGVDIKGYTQDTFQYPAANFIEATQQYIKNGPNTGYFAWDGKVVRILKTSAQNLAAPSSVVADWWVFVDQNSIFIQV